MIDSDQAVAALQDKQTHVRIAAVRSLGARREVSSLQFLVPALRDPAWEVRAAAVWALSSHSGNYHHAGVGRRGTIVSAGAALLIGAAPAVIAFFENVGNSVH